MGFLKRDTETVLRDAGRWSSLVLAWNLFVLISGEFGRIAVGWRVFYMATLFLLVLNLWLKMHHWGLTLLFVVLTPIDWVVAAFGAITLDPHGAVAYVLWLTIFKILTVFIFLFASRAEYRLRHAPVPK